MEGTPEITPPTPQKKKNTDTERSQTALLFCQDVFSGEQGNAE